MTSVDRFPEEGAAEGGQPSQQQPSQQQQQQQQQQPQPQPQPRQQQQRSRSPWVRCRAHLRAAGIGNVAYAAHDVLDPGFVSGPAAALVAAHAAAGRPTVVLGLHLCGALSLRAVQCLRALPGVRALVLAPCCVPVERGADDDATAPPPWSGADTPPSDCLARMMPQPGNSGGGGGTAEQLARWCAFLEARAAVAVAEAAAAVAATATAGEAAPATVVRREEIEGVLTMRKTVVSASCWSPG